MTPRGLLNFFRSRTGAFLLFLLLLGIGYFFVNGLNAPNMSALVKPVVKGPEKTERKSGIAQ